MWRSLATRWARRWWWGLEKPMHIRRHALATAACELIPVPFLDTMVQNRIRREMVRCVAEERRLDLDEAALIAIADEPYAPGRRALLWPVKAVAKKVFFFLTPLMMLHEYHQTVKLGESVGA
jgi:hypothetical protein